MPPTVADIATATHDASPGMDGRRHRVAKAAPKTEMLKISPHPSCSFQNGWLLTAAPGGYFTSRLSPSNSPQLPPTVPSHWRFQGSSYASNRLTQKCSFLARSRGSEMKRA